MRYIFTVILTLLLLPTAYRISYAQQGSLSGKVVDEAGIPLVGATVSLETTNFHVTTQADGTFLLVQVPPATYRLTITFQGRVGYSQSVEIGGGNVVLDEIRLQQSQIALGEVVVSTQRRTQTSIEVPVTVSALSGAALSRLNMRQMDEMATFIPGMEVQLQSPNNPGYVIRGITSDDGDSRTQPRISIFQDGISISRSRASVVELFDIERVEVAKGPQGTLFGRGAQIGALHIIQNKAQDRFGAEVSGGYGAYSHRFVNGYINTPIAVGKLANRLAFNYEGRNGFIGNLSGGRLNGKEVIALRNSTRLWGGANTTADLILNYQYDNYPGTSFKSKRFAPAGGDTDPNTFADLEQGEDLYIKRHVGGATLLVDHRLDNVWRLSSLSGFRAFDSDESFDADGTPAQLLWLSEIAKGTQYSQEFRFTYENNSRFSGFLGAGYFYENSSQNVPMRVNEQVLYPAYIAPILSGQLSGQVSQLGASLGLPEAHVQALAGQIQQLFHTDPVIANGQPQPVENLPNLQPLALGLVSQLMPGGLPSGITWQQLLQSGMLPPGVLPAELITLVTLLDGSPINRAHTESYTTYGRNQAVELFADGTFDLTEQLKLTAGLRGTYETQRGGYRADAASPPSVFGMIANGGSPNLLNPVSDGTIYASKNYYSYVGRLALNYLFGRNNVYGSISRGRRPGVISIFPTETTYLRPEVVWSYEVGLKGLVANGKLGYELSTYYYDWSNFQTLSLQQVPGSIAPQLLADDGGKAHSFGIESGLRYFITPTVNIFGNYAYIDGKFNDTDENGNPQEYAGNRFRLTPDHSFAFGLDADVPLNGRSSVYLRPSYSYKSGVYFEDDNRKDLYQEGYGLTNFTAGYRFVANRIHYEVGAYGKNIFDTHYMIDAGNSGDTIGFPTYIGGSRSIVGAQVRITF
ncbi:TonB-dependent receptor [Parapedobacter koreensis]|uniref:TonB-dependent Receptor Plug Domain n=1 Tax=Parapedobacter koreensis TaxID=332977 RepID=A0A1H7FUH9_9SPHI|nr:TonB-dependent receptor [Parapedobacter koreensis]SEK28152.1 TonB-dependent Receptor Plug Domain [Parapedobacter koreensis]